MIYRYKDYAYDNYEEVETVELLTDQGWPEDVAEEYAKNHKPMYEVEGEFEYDSDTGKLTVISAKIAGVRLTP